MKLSISHLNHFLVKVKAFSVCFYLTLTLVNSEVSASPIQTDLVKLDEMMNHADYEEGIAFADKKFMDYLERGDSLAAYSLLVKKLICLKELDSQDEFEKLSNKILADLSPKDYPKQHRDVMWHKCKYLAHKNYDAYVEQLNAIMVFENQFGSSEKYIDAYLQLTSAEYFVGNVGFAKPLLMLKKIAELEKTKYQTFDYNRQLAMLTKYENTEKADSIYQLAYSLIDAVSLLKTKAGFLREYSQFQAEHNQYAESIEFGLKALALYEKADGRHAYSMVGQLILISSNFKQIGQLDIAREYMDRAIDICDAKELKRRDFYSIDFGDLLVKEGNFESAMIEYQIAVDYFKERNTLMTIVAYERLGTIFLDLNNINAAKNIERELRNYIKLHEVENSIYNQYLLYSRIADFENDPNTVEANLLSALNTGLNLLPSYKLEIYDKLSKIYKDKEEFAQAYNFSQKFLNSKTSLNNNIRLQSALFLEHKYNREAQNSKIALLDSENQLSQERFSSQRKFLIFFGISFFAFLGISFLLLHLFRKVNLQNLVIKKSLEEKDTLLKEIHHRVKNNLQLVSSLLTLQSRDIIDEKAIEAINEGKSRVRSMALIHQDLYSRDNLTGIGMKKYIGNLSQELFSTYQLDDQNIKLELDIDDIYLDVDTIIPIGLIINELITNALKYAFDGQESGNIKISFSEKNNRLLLDVQDDGRGINISGFKKESSFGNKLINTLTEQLEGTLQIEGKDGTHIHLEFMDYKLAS